MCGSGNPQTNPSTSNNKPFTIRQLNDSTFLIRENDGYGEFPHIYAKKCTTTTANGTSTPVILLNDTGVGTTVPRSDGSGGVWTLRSFLEETINPGERLPYLIVLSHCHWDHILGLKHWYSLPESRQELTLSLQWPTNTSIVASSYSKSFLTPYAALKTNSLCEREELHPPRFEPDIWADHDMRLRYLHTPGAEIDLEVICLQTPGHTPDSLSWYDIHEHTLFVGDHLYQRETDDTRNARWGPERPCPIMFPLEGNLADWWESNKMLANFVETENLRFAQRHSDTEPPPRVKLAAGHVTADADAQVCISGAGYFMARVLRDEVPRDKLPFEDRGEEMGHWTWRPRGSADGLEAGEFSVGAPLKVVEEGRRMILSKAGAMQEQ